MFRNKIITPAELFSFLQDRTAGPRCIAIDGIGTAGKTTLAARIAEEFPVQVIHVDDFFLPFEKRSEKRMQTAMGNIEWERLEAEVLTQIGSSSVPVTRFDCSLGSYSAPETYDLSGFIVVEGVSSLRRELLSYYDLKLFIEIPPEERERRIRLRDPEWKQKMWRDQWIPLENAYFAAHSPQESADFIIDGMSGTA